MPIRDLVPIEPKAARTEALPPSLRLHARGPVRIGYGLMLVGVAGSLLWSATAHLASGAVANGIISPDGSRRVVQHLEGGIVHEIKVRDGDEVKVGDPILVLQDTQAAASYDLLLEQARTLAATQARLDAEQNDLDAVVFLHPLLDAKAAKVQSIIRGQGSLFAKRRDAFNAQKRILADRRRQFEEQIGAFEVQIDSIDQQLAIIAEELVGKKVLFAKALTTKPELLRLERTRAALEGDRGRFLGSIAETGQRISEIDAQAISLEAERAQDVSTQMEQVRTDFATISERLNASRDILDRTVISAPISGKIVNLRFKTTGGVVMGGEPILEIVPTEESLLIDARIDPGDIDVITIGLKATVHLTAYSSRSLPKIEGIVRSVSADRLVDPNTGQAYFLARVEVSKEEIDALDVGISLVPGMSAEVLIVTGERTALAYIMEPLRATFRRGLREQ
ncbi:HlyD family type I secretion periplasmic adaptor subunit [Mesorhizobium sp. CAU 1741]|uniref:HlyD family type I secretion periplasmic adaptor subunit n=1 Tax=Mesorhizobium sp. CAU 1741 TaxID=3140366 RepID=UPI00325B0F40